MFLNSIALENRCHCLKVGDYDIEIKVCILEKELVQYFAIRINMSDTLHTMSFNSQNHANIIEHRAKP